MRTSGGRRPAVADVVDPGAADTRHVVVWDFDSPVMSISSAPVGGGVASLNWVVNVGVTAGYERTDLDEHAADIAHRVGVEGTGASLFTAADVRRIVRRSDGDGQDGTVVVDATVGVTKPTWAAGPDGSHGSRAEGGWVPGTINLVVQLPVALTPAAAVNAVMTVTEAKAQALIEHDVPGTGTASDAVVVCWPPTLPAEVFAGPRSPWGARIARATHAAVTVGLEAHP